MLSDKEKNQILFHLGWPLKTIIPESTHYDGIVSNRLTNLNEYIEEIVRKLLCEIEDVRERILEAQKRLSAKKVDSIELRDDEIDGLKNELYRLSKELAKALDIRFLKSSGANVHLCL